jgi:filamentous hemagglutinin family protein
MNGQGFLLRAGLLVGASALALVSTARAQSVTGMVHAPTEALAARSAASTTSRAPVLTVPAQQALQRQQALATRIDTQVAGLREAQIAARTAALGINRVASPVNVNFVSNGLSPQGLVVKPGALSTAGVSLNPELWRGAAAPYQVNSASGAAVTIEQTEAKALLTWSRFDVGAQTQLNFVQRDASGARPDWIALNRVDDPSGAPSQILGRISADGQVYVINRNGVIFGGASQVNVQTFLASSLDIGKSGLSLAQRNAVFFNDGIAATDPSKFVRFSQDSARAGDVIVEAGAQLKANANGSVILTGPRLVNAGSIDAPDGQVILQAGSTASWAKADQALEYNVNPNVPPPVDPLFDSNLIGLALLPVQGSTGSTTNSGIITAARGNISLFGNGGVVQDGLLGSTTAVNRPGSVYIYGPTVVTGRGVIDIAADKGGATIPTDATSLSNFRPSRIRLTTTDLDLLSGSIIRAPSGDFRIDAGLDEYRGFNENSLYGNVHFRDGAVIDVSGLKDVQVSVARNFVQVPSFGVIKGNELRDAPTQRGGPLVNQTVVVDIRNSGIRADGVAWSGTPLIDASGAAQQIQIGPDELLTSGGSITLTGINFLNGAKGEQFTLNPSQIGGNVSQFGFDAGASIDVSGGWVSFQGASAAATQLLRTDGRVVSIDKADPLFSYLGVAGQYESTHRRWGKQSSDFFSGPAADGRFEAGYIEGRDAGSLTVAGFSGVIEGQVYGQSFPGDRQLEASAAGSRTVANDLRKLQSAARELPAAARFAIGTGAPGGSTIDNDTRAGLDAAIVSGASPTLRQAVNAPLTRDANGALVYAPQPNPRGFVGETDLRTLTLSSTRLNSYGLAHRRRLVRARWLDLAHIIFI